ncbi:MAG TPA: CapA family protein [Verrucomicrobiae bacterium]|nr:CapA family protein [Verrucomicrobiae bacterium]
MKETKIIIGGDVCPTHRNTEFFCRGDARSLFNDLLAEFEAADLSVVNLECPLIAQASPIAKTGPVLEGPTESVNGLVRSHIRCLGLANNHILDHGASGLENTLRACAAAGIQTFGAGRNLAEAGRMLVTTAGPLRIGLLGASEQEWSIATENSPGANPLDLIDCARTLNRHRDQLDYSIVLLHDGAEHYPFPSPRLQKVCRFLIEQGADLVVCQHSHCAGAHESHGDGHIIYGQGNLISDWPDRDGTWHEGFLIRLTLTPDQRVHWQPVPYTQSDSMPGARRMPADRARVFLGELAERSQAIKDDGFVARSWEQFCRRQRHGVMNFVLGHGRLLGRLNQNGWVVRHVHGKQRLREIRNCVGSDTNREVLLEALNQCLGED